MLELDYKEIINNIDHNKSYKQELKSFISNFKSTKRKINILSNKIAML